MTVEIVTVPTFGIAASKIVERWRDKGRPNPIRFEGFDGAGKSGLAKLVSEIVGGEHIEGDKFVRKFDEPPPYPKCIIQAELDAAVQQAFDSCRITILDAVCLEEVAPSARWGRGFVVYVKRLSFNNSDPSWHEGTSLEFAPPDREVHRSIHLYHCTFKPHMNCDLIVEIPNEGHTVTVGAFSREWCFDPPESVLLPP